MRRAGSLFEIDQEPLFEPGSLEADDGAREQSWDGGYDDLPPTSATVARHAAEVPGARLGGGRRVLVVVAAIGVAGFLGSRLTQVAGSPTVAPRAAATSAPPAVAAPVADLVPARRRQASRPRRARSAAASRHAGASRSGPAERRAARARQASPLVTAALPAVSVPAPRHAAPPPHVPQGFSGEFF